MNTNAENKICGNCKTEFIIDSGDLILYEKVGLDTPNKCFECRVKQYLAFWNFGKFRKGTSDLSGESLITVLPQKPRFPVYKSAEWWGDSWDPMVYGQDYDPNRPFFDQLKELQERVPRPHQVGENNVNCDWSDDVWQSKNCYLTRAIFRGENVSYGYRVVDSKDSLDIVYSFNLQNSYDCLGCHDSFNINFCEKSKDCLDSFFLFDCRNCQDCFMSWNLRNKQYCIRNEQYTKEAYEEELKKVNFSSYTEIEKLKQEFNQILQKEAAHRENFNIKATNSTGNYLTNCDKCVNCFSWENSQNCRNHLRGFGAKDCIDEVGVLDNELSGNNACNGPSGAYALKHSSWSNGRYSEYLDLCIDSEYCFGCVGLRKKKYCILNKQYSKENYEELKGRIIEDMTSRGEYGEFLPYSMGLGDYNFSTGMIYFPDVKKEEILNNGGYWSDEDVSSHDGISSLELPDSIEDTEASVSTQALICPKTKYRFNIASSEYEFHKRKGFALPRKHFDLRILEKAQKTGVLKTYPYACCYCGKNINAYYPPEWGYKKIACEDCYKQNIS